VGHRLSCFLDAEHPTSLAKADIDTEAVFTIMLAGTSLEYCFLGACTIETCRRCQKPKAFWTVVLIIMLPLFLVSFLAIVLSILRWLQVFKESLQTAVVVSGHVPL